MLIDHFAVLGLSPSASGGEIKSAYRQLVRLHHPDINPHDAQAADRFRAIQLAYETLTKPSLRQSYLEKRWYAQYRNETLCSQPLSLDSILRECIELERFAASLDAYRMDRSGLYQFMLQRIREWQAIGMGKEDEQLTVQIIQLLTRSAAKLDIAQAESLHETIRGWLRTNQCADLIDEQWLIKKRQFDAWQQRMPYVVLLLTIALSLIIWLASR